ncbi:MAG: domain containing protein [Hyphomicrobiales bacterium]|nr:domain containing protein [Hyphomicrobiales bacterium]
MTTNEVTPVSDYQQPPTAPAYWPARLPYQALAGVRTRRMMALGLDLIAISFLFGIFFVVFLVLGLPTLGLAWFAIPLLFPAIALFYNGLSVSGPKMGTPGMRAMDLQMRNADGSRVSFITAAAHAVLFYLSWTMLTPLVLLVSLISNDKRCLHDIVAGVVVTRRA